jgi:hypothetical protein
MKAPAFIVALGLCAAPALADTFHGYRLEAREVAGAVFVLKGYDASARTITVSGDTGTYVLRVDDRTARAVSLLSPGEKVLVSYRYNANAEAEVTVRQIPAGYYPAASRTTDPSRRVVVLSSEPDRGVLTIRDARGSTRRLAVDASMAADIADLRPGDRVLVDVEAGRVVGISRSY